MIYDEELLERAFSIIEVSTQLLTFKLFIRLIFKIFIEILFRRYFDFVITQTFNALSTINKIKEALRVKYNFANDKNTSTSMTKIIKKFKTMNNLKSIVEKVIKMIDNDYCLILEINVRFNAIAKKIKIAINENNEMRNEILRDIANFARLFIE